MTHRKSGELTRSGQERAAAVADEHRHPEHLGHHYETLEQQFSSGKLGMWLFLATEILLFAGLFCAYAVNRRNHPEVFHWGHELLNVRLGAVNTVFLICSSFTMAYGVRCAQLGRRLALIVSLALTLAFACGFMVIKYVEYSEKFRHGYLWAKLYDPHAVPHGGTHAEGEATGEEGVAAGAHGEAPSEAPGAAPALSRPAPAVSEPAAAEGAGPQIERTLVPPPADAPRGLAPETTLGERAPPRGASDRGLGRFFTFYFLMTGLHGLHVLAGMIVITWLIVRAFKGHFGPKYFTPVDLGGLYWHLVDLIWIYLFPLLYLIS
jgi:cytochrome c oxidase subunit 3